MKRRLIILLLLLPAIVSAQKKYEERYENGQLAVTGFKNRDTGEYEGHWIVYGQDGKKIKECDFKHGLEEGTLYEYNIYGQLTATTEYCHGKREGLHVEHHFFINDSTKRVVKLRCHYHNGLEDGMLYEYDEHGKLTRKSMMRQGFPITDTLYQHDGIKYMAYRHPEEKHRTNWGSYDDWDVKFIPYHQQLQVASAAPVASHAVRKVQPRRPVRKTKVAKPRKAATPKPVAPKRKLTVGKDGVIEYK